VNGWLKKSWAALAVVVMLLSGCSGVLLESQGENGKVDRLKLDGERWSSYDKRPRDPYVNSGRHGLDDMTIMLKSQRTF